MGSSSRAIKQAEGIPKDLRSVQLKGLPKGMKKKEVESWVEKMLPGNSGLESIRRVFGDDSVADKLNAFVVTFKKESNAKQAMEVLEGAEIDGHDISASFHALERSHHSAKAGRLIVRNLAFAATAKHVRKHFAKLGELLDVHLPPKAGAGPGDGSHRGFAFVQYADVADAARAIKELNGTKICGRGVAVDASVEASVYHTLQREVD